MRFTYLLGFVVALSACSSSKDRLPASKDLSGSYLGEGKFSSRRGKGGLVQPAVRLYLKQDGQNTENYYGVILEYDKVTDMALPYLTAQKAPRFSSVVGHLKKIAYQISVYHVVPVRGKNSYELKPLQVVDNSLRANSGRMFLEFPSKKPSDEHALVGAKIVGGPDGEIIFPSANKKRGTLGKIVSLGGLLPLTQYELVDLTYRKAKLSSTWRTDYSNLKGSYLSAYARNHDGVLELKEESNNTKSADFIASKTKAQDYTNPKSAGLSGTYDVIEPATGIFVLKAKGKSASDRILDGRMGLFLDIFDASAPEAGGHMVVEIAFTSASDPKDFLMYYQHPDHLKGVGVR